MINKTYFNCKVKVWKVNYDFPHPYPWSFSVEEPSGVVHSFCGIPNQCETSKAALKRAWWRAKWIMDTSINDRYI